MSSVKFVVIGDTEVTWQMVMQVAQEGALIKISENANKKIQVAREAIDAIVYGDKCFYGINTGLGALCDKVLTDDELADLSYHTLMSHAAGVGEPLSVIQVRAIMVCALINYSHGHSGISPAIIDRLVYFLNNNITPVVPQKGSVGYLTHMAHIGLALIGQSQVYYQHSLQSSLEVMRSLNLPPIVLQAKDGLSLVNGTPAMTALATVVLARCQMLADWADAIAALSFEVLGGQLDALDDIVIVRKKHLGVQQSAALLHRILRGSQRIHQLKGIRLQDALSIRSIPQVHGACRDQWRYASEQIVAELNSSTDNPLVISEGSTVRIVSQANPHGESIAIACDNLCIAISEWTSISERRIYRLVTPQITEILGLPAFLSSDVGSKSGMMILQYTAASLSADNKRLAVPAVTDNYLTSGLQEDHISFGDSAALKAMQALDNAFMVLAMEYLCVCQAMEYLSVPDFSPNAQKLLQSLRQCVAFYDETHPIAEDISKASDFISSTKVENILMSDN